jgi:hypothetical protein
MFGASYDDSVRPSVRLRPSGVDLLHRATVSYWAAADTEAAAFADWREQWKSEVAFVSHDYGCGCCIHLFDILGSKEAVAHIPKRLHTISAWTHDA